MNFDLLFKRIECVDINAVWPDNPELPELRTKSSALCKDKSSVFDFSIQNLHQTDLKDGISNDFRLKSDDFLLKNDEFRLKSENCITKLTVRTWRTEFRMNPQPFIICDTKSIFLNANSMIFYTNSSFVIQNPSFKTYSQPFWRYGAPPLTDSRKSFICWYKIHHRPYKSIII